MLHQYKATFLITSFTSILVWAIFFYTWKEVNLLSAMIVWVGAILVGAAMLYGISYVSMTPQPIEIDTA